MPAHHGSPATDHPAKPASVPPSLARTTTVAAAALATAVAALAASGSAQAAAEFKLYDLGLYANNGAQAMAVNNSGQAAGLSTVGLTSTANAFFFNGQTLTNLHTQGGNLLGGYSGSTGYGLNEAGTSVGQALRSNITAYVPYISLNGGTMTEINNPLGAGNSGTAGGVARDINNQGLVVGSAYTAGNTSIRAFAWDSTTGQGVNLGSLGGSQSEATAVNDAGVAVGWSYLPNFTRRAVSFAGGVAQDLGTLGGAQAQANGINDQGQVVGWAHTASGAQHAFAYQNGTMTDLGTFSGLGSSVAKGVNDAGWVVGDAHWGGQYGDHHAFLYRDGQLQDLNNLIDPNLGVTLLGAQAVSDTGYIVAWGRTNLTTPRAFLLTPEHLLPTSAVPEPASWALSSLGVLAMLARRRPLRPAGRAATTPPATAA